MLLCFCLATEVLTALSRHINHCVLFHIETDLPLRGSVSQIQPRHSIPVSLHTESPTALHKRCCPKDAFGHLMLLCLEPPCIAEAAVCYRDAASASRVKHADGL